MSIAKTKEVIEAIPHGHGWDTQYGDLEADGLKALAESHTRLLEAAKKALYHLRNYTDLTKRAGAEFNLEAAITEAEK